MALQAEGIMAWPITLSMAETAANLRTIYSLATPDSLQLAAMLDSRATHILSNDRDFESCPEACVITLGRGSGAKLAGRCRLEEDGGNG